MIESPALQAIAEELRPYRRIGVAFSGGVDSATLLAAAAHILGSDSVIAFLGVSASLAERERLIAHQITKSLGVRLVEIHTQEMSNPQYIANDGNRCYFCKSALFEEIAKIDLQAFQLDAIAYGENRDDSLKNDRPGQRAAREFGIAKPLSDAGLSKSDVRALARTFNLQVAEKPATPCLASRIKPFTPVSNLALRQVEMLEDFLLSRGFSDVRARYLGEKLFIEVAEDSLSLLSDPKVQDEITSFALTHQLPEVNFSDQPIRSGSFSATHLNSAHVS